MFSLQRVFSFLWPVARKALIIMGFFTTGH